MENFLKYLLDNIIQNKEMLSIEKIEQSNADILFKITVANEDKGIIIGKKGKNIKAIRDILNILAKKEGKRISLKIED